jgi:hypothetical protein
MSAGYSEDAMEDDGYAIFWPPPTRSTFKGEPQTRHFAVIVHKPADDGDPIPFLVAIYRAEMVEAYWRGTRAEAEEAFSSHIEKGASDRV